VSQWKGAAGAGRGRLALPPALALDIGECVAAVCREPAAGTPAKERATGASRDCLVHSAAPTRPRL
jgi:hypothetical protein